MPMGKSAEVAHLQLNLGATSLSRRVLMWRYGSVCPASGAEIVLDGDNSTFAEKLFPWGVEIIL